jgi:hypothetical protein
MRCPECGSEVAGNATMCTACGAHLTGATTSEVASGGRGFVPRVLEPRAAVINVAFAAIILGLLAYGLWFFRAYAVWGGDQFLSWSQAITMSLLPAALLLLFVLLAVACNLTIAALGDRTWVRRFAGGFALMCTAGLVVGFYWLLPGAVRYAEQIDLAHANFFSVILLVAIVGVIIINVLTAQAGRVPFIRRIAGLNAIDEAVGRATEMGRPILFSTGLAGLDIVSLQALAVAGHVARSAVRYGARLIMPVCDQTMMPVTEQVIREVYAAEGRPEAYRPEDVRYLSDRQFAYAAGVTGILHRERVAASFLFGQFYAESLILAENGQAVGAIQVAGTPDLLQIPFFVVTCDYTIIGDEYYAASAYISREPTLLGSIVGQDIAKALVIVLIATGIGIAVFVQYNSRTANPLYMLLGGQ